MGTLLRNYNLTVRFKDAKRQTNLDKIYVFSVLHSKKVLQRLFWADIF